MFSAFVLHARPWRETSLIPELLCFEAGRVGVLARGARRPGRGRGNSLQPFMLLALDWRGRGELPALVTHELLESYPLTGSHLYAGLYLNELLMRLLRRGLPQPEIFRSYTRALARLHHGQPLESSLRRFELELVTALGYGVSLLRDQAGEAVIAGVEYVLEREAGLRPRSRHDDRLALVLEGAHLRRIAAGELEDPAVRRTAKLLTRALLAPLLGDQPLQSRALFRQQAGAFRKPD